MSKKDEAVDSGGVTYSQMLQEIEALIRSCMHSYNLAPTDYDVRVRDEVRGSVSSNIEHAYLYFTVKVNRK